MYMYLCKCVYIPLLIKTIYLSSIYIHKYLLISFSLCIYIYLSPAVIHSNVYKGYVIKEDLSHIPLNLFQIDSSDLKMLWKIQANKRQVVEVRQNGWMDGWIIDGQTDGRTDGRTDRWIDKQMNGLMNVIMEGFMF